MLLTAPEELCVNDIMCETKAHGTSSFRFQAYRNESRERPVRGEGWHWHPEAEFLCVLEGKVRFGINEERFELGAGDAAFINCGALHMAGIISQEYVGSSVSLVFAPEFLAEDRQSLLYNKYIKPVAEDQQFKGCVFRKYQGSPWKEEILGALEKVCQYCQEEDWLCQLKVRNELSRAWGILAEYKGQEKGLYARGEGNRKLEQRVKQILDYMQAHYAEPITVEDISKNVNLSRTECFRCFHKITGASPLEYLNLYRIRQAAFKLRNTDQTVTEICIGSGFSHPSYFGKKFRQIYGVSPAGYRKMGEK